MRCRPPKRAPFVMFYEVGAFSPRNVAPFVDERIPSLIICDSGTHFSLTVPTIAIIFSPLWGRRICNQVVGQAKQGWNEMNGKNEMEPKWFRGNILVPSIPFISWEMISWVQDVKLLQNCEAEFR